MARLPVRGARLGRLLRRPGLLLLAIGNDCRGDDGLGWALAREVEQVARQGAVSCRVEYRYQLQVEDAALLRTVDVVLFVDASAAPLEHGLRFSACRASFGASYTTHELSPQALLGLCMSLYARFPEAWLLELEGADFTLGRRFTATAKASFYSALRELGLDYDRGSDSCNINEILTI